MNKSIKKGSAPAARSLIVRKIKRVRRQLAAAKAMARAAKREAKWAKQNARLARKAAKGFKHELADLELARQEAAKKPDRTQKKNAKRKIKPGTPARRCATGKSDAVNSARRTKSKAGLKPPPAQIATPTATTESSGVANA